MWKCDFSLPKYVFQLLNRKKKYKIYFSMIKYNTIYTSYKKVVMYHKKKSCLTRYLSLFHALFAHKLQTPAHIIQEAVPTPSSRGLCSTSRVFSYLYIHWSVDITCLTTRYSHDIQIFPVPFVILITADINCFFCWNVKQETDKTTQNPLSCF